MKDGECRGGRVYPRVCGGTVLSLDERGAGSGLSPRVRGNHFLPHGLLRARGSIPACAGEPITKDSCCARVKVYPRVCGGTWGAATDLPTTTGLSPRVRGNRQPA